MTNHFLFNMLYSIFRIQIYYIEALLYCSFTVLVVQAGKPHTGAVEVFISISDPAILGYWWSTACHTKSLGNLQALPCLPTENSPLINNRGSAPLYGQWAAINGNPQRVLLLCRNELETGHWSSSPLDVFAVEMCSLLADKISASDGEMRIYMPECVHSVVVIGGAAHRWFVLFLCSFVRLCVHCGGKITAFQDSVKEGLSMGAILWLSA